FAVCPLLMLSCRTYDATDVRGALAGAAAALEAADAVQLFPYIDERARFALASTVKSRADARKLIESEYPPSERAAALAALGDAGEVATPAELFARRCAAECLRTLAGQVGAPVTQEPDGNELRVTTSRGTTLHMFAGQDGRYGIVWNTAACAAERARASRDFRQIQENAAVYRKRRELSGQ
ncbi:MAG TPA: hypothetical protein VJR89_22890, partial [Polyangiales bacterium]|nr:hypothetical protein [Polyangiales bacterium]